MQEFKTIDDCKNYLKENNLKQQTFYCNVYGWDTYYTLEPTFATPTGKLKEFPRSKLITL